MARGTGRSKRGAAKVEKSATSLTLDEIKELIQEMNDDLKEFISEKLDELDLGVDDSEEEDDADDDAEDPDDVGDDLEEEEILKMKKAELLELIEDEELDVDPKEFKKIADLREAVCEAYFEEFDE